MSKIYPISGFALIAGLAVSYAIRPSPSAKERRVSYLNSVMEKVRPLHTPLGPPQDGDWLTKHPELGQTFVEYLQSVPVTLQDKRNIIYVQPLGDFTPAQRKIVTLTADFMSRYFSARVKLQDDLPLSLIPDDARRKNPNSGTEQILTTYVLDEVLKPRLPRDAAASIAFTASNLWPGEGWNFVYGQASLANRVGVWSIYLSGEPDESEAEFRLCLLRTMKTAVHETGHMFSIQHCTKYECNMCGSNNREERDRHPLEACPECLAKICHATGADPAERFRKLADFCREQGFEYEQKYYERSLAAVTSGNND